MARSRNTADTQTASGGPVSPSAVGKNKIINGDFGIWQRGTSVALGGYSVDRFRTTGIGNCSRQTFSPGTAPVAGYEGQYFARWNLTSNSQNYDFGQRVEDARTFAGQTVTFSFWAKASATTSNAFFPRIFQNFGTGGSPSSAVYTDGSNINLTTSWTRYTVTLAIPSVSGKTFGTNNDSYLGVILQCNTTSVVDLDFWGWQLEAGSVATPFQTATGTIQGELAACQRYYFLKASGANQSFGMAAYNSASDIRGSFGFPVEMRVVPTMVSTSGTNYYRVAGITDYFDSLTLWQASTKETAWYNVSQASGTTGQGGVVWTDNASASIALSAEL